MGFCGHKSYVLILPLQCTYIMRRGIDTDAVVVSCLLRVNLYHRFHVMPHSVSNTFRFLLMSVKNPNIDLCITCCKTWQHVLSTTADRFKTSCFITKNLSHNPVLLT